MNEILFLADLSVLRPDPGFIFWTSLVFLVVWFGLGRVAFKPIQKALRDRERTIADSLDEAKRAREEMSQLQTQNKELIAQAQEERAKIVQEARAAKASMIAEAKDEAKAEAAKVTENAMREIQNQKDAAMKEVKNEVALMAMQVAEKLLHRELDNPAAKQEYTEQLVREMNTNA